MQGSREVILFNHATSQQLYSSVLPIPAQRSPSDLIRSLLILAQNDKANLTGVDLMQQDLTNLDLSGLKMNKGQFLTSDLSGASLAGSNLNHANFEGARLVDADLSGADLRHAQLAGVDLQGANLVGADLRHADLDEADLRGANLQQAKFESATMRSADLEGADLRDAIFTYCVANGVNFTDVNFDGIQFYMSDLKEVVGITEEVRVHAMRSRCEFAD